MDHINDNQPDQHLNADSPPPPTPPEASDGDEAQAAEPRTFGEWFRTNGSTLLFMLLLIGACLVLNEKYSIIGLDAALKVAVGLGFIIFIHELGHFLVAKLCDVHVTTFSIGFGPALPYCSFTWGETTYKLAMFPLGGYVQMVGQVDLDEGADSGDDDPRSYKNKSVWQRMAIISAGVTMNALFACVAFAAVFLINGKTRLAANVDLIESGKPAFTQGLRTGDEILRVNNIEHPYFDDLKIETVATLGKIELVAQRPGIDKEPITYDIMPHKGSMRVIGILYSSRLKLRAKKSMPEGSAPTYPESAAAKAETPFEFDDVIVGVTNPEDPSKFELPDDRRNPGGHMKDYFEFERRMTLLAGKEATIRVERGEGAAKHAVDIKVPPDFHRVVDARMKMGQIVAVRDKSQAADPKTGVCIPRKTETEQKLDGDVIEKVEVIEPDGKKTVFEKGVNLDPVRLPDQLKAWAARLWVARKNNPITAERKVKLYVKRQSMESASPVYLQDLQVVELDWDFDWRFDKIVAMSATCPQAIPELGLAYLVRNQVDTVEGEAKDDRLQKDDEIVDLKYVVRNPDGSKTEGSWQKKSLQGVEWAHICFLMQGPEIVKVTLKVKRGEEEKELEITPRTDETWPLSDNRGLFLEWDTRLEKADNVFQAVGMGFRDTYRSILQVYLQLRGFFAGTISVLDNLGGPLEIGKWAYRFAQADIWDFIFFLGSISVNLAVINFLPIPVLDGGHMVFLIYEKVRGKPASESVRNGATLAGGLLLGSLMIFVFALDIRRMVSG